MSVNHLAIASSLLLSPKQLRQNTVWGIFRSLTVTLLYLAFYPVYIGFLGLEVFGVWILFMSLVLYLQLGFLNLPQAATKFVSDALARQDALLICRYATSLLGGILGISLLILLLSLASREFLPRLSWIPEPWASQVPYLIGLTALITVQAILAETLGGILSGLGRMDRTYQMEILRHGVAFLASLGLLFKGYQLLAFFYGGILSYLLQLVVLVFFIRRSLGFLPLGLQFFSWPRLVETARFSGPLCGGSLMYCLLGPFNRLMLGYMISPAATAVYEIADRAGQALRSVAEMGLRPYLPQISGLTALGDFEQIRRVTIRLIKTIVIWGTPIFILFFLTADEIVAIWLRSAARPEISGNMRIILWAYYLNLLAFPVYYAFMGMGLVGRCFRNHLVMTLTNVPLAIVFLWGVREVWAVSLAMTVSFGLAALDQIWLFLRTRGEAISLISKGLRALSWPFLFFAPLILLRGHQPLLLAFGGVAGLLYVLWMKRGAKVSPS